MLAGGWSKNVVALLVGSTIAACALVACGGDEGDGSAGVVEASDEAEIAGVTVVPVDRAVHVNGSVEYSTSPPAGGNHNQAWQNCGFYDQPILNKTAVHSMEHGAVWITFRPDLPGDQVDQIRALAQQDFVLASRWPDGDLPAPIVVSAWGAQLWLEALPDAAADEFVATHRQGPGAPEAGEPCTGGHAGTR